MKLVKRNNRIYTAEYSPLFRHCTGGFDYVHEREYPDVEKVLRAHNVHVIHVKEDEYSENAKDGEMISGKKSL